MQNSYCNMNDTEIRNTNGLPLGYAYKSSSAGSSENPALPDVPAGAADGPPSGNLKLLPKPRDCWRFCYRVGSR